MSLVLNANADAAADDYQVLHGQLLVGQIYKRKVTLRPDSEWLWALNGVPEGASGAGITGLAGTLDEAMEALKKRWAKWLTSAALSEAEQLSELD
jgi:hypothetical protein